MNLQYWAAFAGGQNAALRIGSAKCPSFRQAACMSANRIRYLAVFLCTMGLTLVVVVRGQEAPVATPVPAEGVKVEATPGGPVTMGPDGKPVPRSKGGPPGTPTGPGQPGAPGAKPDEKKDQPPTNVNRPDKPPLPPDPRELGVTPNPEGKLRFNFHGQRWADVLEWLAKVSGMSLDWQELPGDYLNLVTQREYTVPEARDMVNRHLLARGFTMLQQGEVLSVVSIPKLIPGMVPRVEASELAKHMPNEYVKVSFALDWLLSEKAVEELKPMLSPNAKITALKNTNRIEVMDVVVNLREVHALLQREQSHDDEQSLVKEFPLKHTRAEDVLQQLRSLLGMEAKATPARPMSPEEMMQQQQQQQMMMQMQRQQGGQPMPPGAKKEEEVHLVANARKNSILANAPPDKMAIVSQAILAIDVESDRAQSLLTNINRMQVYRLHTVDPDALVRTLREVGEMDPGTRLEVDTKNKAVIAYASMADHLTIRQVVERLDGSTRRFEVIHLRRLEADYVAGTIDFMMTGPKQQDQQQPRYYDFYYSGRSSSRSEESTDKFRVDADVENNRLLVWANEVELEEVTNLLVKLGEIPAQSGRADRIRVLEAIPPDQLQELIDKLRQTWPSLAPNQLNLPPPPPTKEPDNKKPPIEPLRGVKEARLPTANDESANDESDSLLALLQVPAEKVETQTKADETDRPAEAPATEAPPRDARPNQPLSRSPERGAATPPPPIDISLTPDGRLMISSQDTQALDILEELIGQVAPPRRSYRVFTLKYADSYWVSTYLESFFDDSEQKKESGSSRVYYYDYAPPKKDDTQYRLSKRRKLKFIDDPDTNSILVQGGDSEQLKTIEELIAVYDQPQQADANAARLTAAFPIRYSKAQAIAEAVKDVYRDLLSDNDKALQNNQNPEQKNRQVPGGSTYIFNEGGDASNEKERTRVTFKGKLSIGVDELTNTLLVSTEGEILMRNVTEMVKGLDEAARPLSSVSVIKLNGTTNSAKVREVLSRMLTEPKPAQKKPDGQQQPQQQQQQQEQVQQEFNVPPYTR
jgi:type II secretory pathway component GspD/PulD (secretin)